jgi:hypothetical protein
MRSRKTTGLWLLVAMSLAMSTACIRWSGPSSLRRDLSREAGVELDAEVAITVTRSGVALARLFTDGDEIPLKGVRRVEVGVYEVKGLREGVDEPRRLTLPDLPGLTPVVRVHEEGEDVFVLVQLDEDEEIRQMVVVVAEDDEWVLVRIKGKLTKSFEKAMQMAFANTDRPDKYEKVMTAYNETKAEQEAEVAAAR